MKHTRLMQPAYAITCLLACFQCESFQPSQAACRYSIMQPHTPTALYERATERRRALSVNGRKKNGKTRNGIKTRRQSSSQSLDRENPLQMEDIDESAYIVKDKLLGHQLLTAKEEKILGRKIRRAVKLKVALAKYVEQRRLQILERQEVEPSYGEDFGSEYLRSRRSAFSVEEYDELEELSVFGLQTNRLEYFDRQSLHMDGDIDSWDYDRLQETAYSIVESIDDYNFPGGVDPYSLSVESLLTDEEMVEEFGLAGGRDELARILVEGALAKERMISCNIRLVVSIAKKWCQRSPMGGMGKAQYTGSWGIPSLDEAVQEGIFGLSTAADRFEPERNLKFGTYATHWITNSVRQCFNRARVGLRVPESFHAYRQKYQTYVRKQYQLTGTSVSVEDAAEELRLSPARLAFILKLTSTPTSIDVAPNSPSQVAGQAGKAGATDQTDASYTISNMLSCSEPSLMDQIEISLLRQCLENAMATELSPHERDVLRLRHGLDDGVSRSTREVAEICGGSISQADVRTAEIRACRKLRSPYSVHTLQLREFLDFVGADISTAKDVNKIERKM
eukprot:scaffold4949_cov134-Cylindrotheca_fusiformis.AAC.1